MNRFCYLVIINFIAMLSIFTAYASEQTHDASLQPESPTNCAVERYICAGCERDIQIHDIEDEFLKRDLFDPTLPCNHPFRMQYTQRAIQLLARQQKTQ